MNKRVLISGSVAYDTIMVFDGYFKDHILPDQTHMINVAFLAPQLKREFGGCAANIAYNLQGLGGAPSILAAVGRDGGDYVARLQGLGIDCSRIVRLDDHYTAQAFITTDLADNQITAFHPGAMSHAEQSSARAEQGSVGWAIVAASTIYAFGKTFLWSTTLGLTSEQFPKGGALTLNGVSAVGVLFLGVLGSPFIGYQQDQDMHQRLTKDHGALLAQVAGPSKPSIFGETPSLDQEKIKALDATAAKELNAVQADSKRGAFTNIAVLPGFMLVCYLGMFFWFRAKGGYKPVDLAASH